MLNRTGKFETRETHEKVQFVVDLICLFYCVVNGKSISAGLSKPLIYYPSQFVSLLSSHLLEARGSNFGYVTRGISPKD